MKLNLPTSLSIQDGHIFCGGADCVKLAEEFGTPDPEVKQKTPAKESEKFGKPVKLTSGQPLGERRVYQYLVLKKSADVKSALSL